MKSRGVFLWMSLCFCVCDVAMAKSVSVSHKIVPTVKHSLYASLRAKVNWRCGPGAEHDVSWLYESPGWPVLVLKKYDKWYYIQDHLGTRGWVKGSMLHFKVMLLIVHETMLYAKPNAQSRPKAKLLKGALVRYIKSHDSHWVHVSIPEKSIHGWIASHSIWPNPSQNLTFNIEPSCARTAHPVRQAHLL